MADDIDIEEHDVLESLRRRQMPDAVVKQEPVDEEYAESHYQPSSEYYDQQWDWESHGGVEPAQIKEEKSDETDDIPFGKIILGSKPPESTEIKPPEAEIEEKEHGQENYNYNMSLVLEDWGPILEASNCYCPDCQTLFATVNALDAHKMIAHSFLVAMEEEVTPERNKAIKSTAKPNENDIGSTCEICKFTFKGERQGKYNLLRHYRKVHQIDPSTIKSVNELKNWKICNHCNVYFPSDTALVKHLYELLPLNDNKNDEKPPPVKVQTAVKATNEKPTPKIVQIERKPVKADPVPTVSSFDTMPTPKPVVVKTVKPTPKQANSMILGSKINGVRVDDKSENVVLPSSKLRQCEVCGVEYSRKYYIIHMRKFHSDVLLAKINRLKKNHPVNVSTNVRTNVRFKCMMCNLIFDGPSSARKHKALKHPEMKRKKMFLKIVQTNKVQKVKNKTKVLNKVKKPPQNEDSELIVSKSTLFKCNRCSVHFLTCYGACAHSRVCETSSNMRDWSCPQCQRVFKNVDKKAHEFQHQFANSKFKVYVVYLEMVVRILCECPCCYVCFEEYKFWRHIKFGCERDTESFFCNECRLPIDMTSKTNHESKHTQGDFTKEDFIKVDFISSNNDVKVKIEPKEKDIPVPALKRKLAAPVVGTEKISKKTKELNLFYCPSCKLYVTKKVSPHSTGECRKCKSVKLRIPCKICGISFTASSSAPHARLHKKYPNLSLGDLTFTRITDDKKIKPLPEYYPCKKCHVNFFFKGLRYRHECAGIKSINCQVCQKKIEKSSFKMHMRFHNYVLPGKKVQKMVQSAMKSPSLPRENELKSQSPTKLKRNEPKSTVTETGLPELLMKYQSLTTLWNILYVCATCDTFTDSYDKVVEHCQNHFTNMESYGVVIMKCQICNMKFDRECYRRHLELHAGGNDINRKSFKILRYDHSKLFSAEWLNFIDLPEDQKAQILTRSMYREKRYVRMRLEQQGPPEYTLYRCKQCQKCISPEAIIHHMTLKNCMKANKLICPLCSMAFANRTTFAQHQRIHETTHLEADSFRIVAFNDSSDGDLNKKILNEYNVGEVVVTEEPPKNPDFFAKYPDNVKLVKGNKFYMFYKCSDCEVCTLDAVTADHVCPTAKKICPKCGLTFSSNKFNEHTKLHDEIMFSDKNVFTRSFYSRPVAKASKDTSKNIPVQTEIRTEEANLYKCHCGLHFTSLKTIEKHYQNKNCSSVVREKCSHCSLVFDPNEIVNHLCKHHANTQFQLFKIVIPNKKTVYKCKQCHVLFYDKRIGGVHSQKCDGVSNGTKCDACGLAFDKLSINIHRDEHKASGQSKLDCYLVENITNDSKVDNNVLYKCKKCNIHYVEQNSARDHAIKYNHQTHQVKKCDQCSLRFTVKTLSRHVELHHNMLKIDRFRIKCIPVHNKSNAEEKTAASKVKVNKETTQETIHEGDLTIESQMMRETGTYKIYRCKKCKLHFTDDTTLLKHNDDRCSKELVEVCELCSLKFSVKNMNTHKKQHNGDETIKMDITERNYEDEDLAFDDDINDTAAEEVAESRSGIDLNLYKCKHCSLHFNVKRTVLSHIAEGCVTKRAPVRCDECNVPFPSVSAIRHKNLHDKYGLKKEDFKIICLPDSERINVKPTGFNDENSQLTNDTAATLDSSIEETSQTEDNVSEIKTNADLEAEVGANSKNISNVQIVKIDPETSQQSEVDLSIDKTKTKLYKCGDCNVYFIAQKTCYKHVTKHTPLDPKDYIECKLCGFQFLIAVLQTHIKKHHADEFRLDDVLVQEYHPGVVKNNYPDYEIYFAIDKEQSGLVSTSSDVNNDINDLKTIDNKETENDCSKVSEVVSVGSTEVSSNCNELTEKNDALDKT
ncbi:hypothetical protein MSG28_016023 [Choristoneura fumiferana]|uniref:Uncharacterized protein n=1 Tax=Choristoneura fumiferana TaxID=7141 RepID=A0ACC0K686_CHOFU|nr:hypothetical protein MSG28_016023 [Choristoneura fumiferana]